MKRMSSFALYIAYPRSKNSVITVQHRDHPYSRQNQPVPTGTNRNHWGATGAKSGCFWPLPGLPANTRNQPEPTGMPHPGQPYPTLVNRGEP